MSGKSKASDRTNLGTGAAPINCQYNPVNSRFMKIIRHQIPVIPDPSPVKMAFKTVIRSIVWLTAVGKLFLLYFKTTEYSLPLLFCQSSSNQIQEYSVFYNILCIPPFCRIWSPKYGKGHHKQKQETGRIFKSMEVPQSFCNFIFIKCFIICFHNNIYDIQIISNALHTTCHIRLDSIPCTQTLAYPGCQRLFQRGIAVSLKSSALDHH